MSKTNAKSWPIRLTLGAVGLLLAAMVGSGLFAYRAVQQIKVNGPIYTQIVSSKDLVADILPPPEYVIESYLTVLQLEKEKDVVSRKGMIDHLDQLIHDFKDRHAYWDANLPAGATRDALLKESFEPAVAFYKVVKEQFIPALESNDQVRAQELANGPIKSLYYAHRQAIDHS